MQNTESILNIYKKRSFYNLKIKNVYKTLTNSFINENTLIYNKLSAKKYIWNENIKNDSILQRRLYEILKVIFDEKFLDCSHWHKENRKGIHTALTDIRQHGKACEFFIQGKFDDLKINFNVLLNIIANEIDDVNFINLIRKLLKKCKFNDQFNYKTFSGTLQSNNDLLNLFINIYLNELDHYINDHYKNKYNFGETRKRNINYDRLHHKIVDHSNRLNNRKNSIKFPISKEEYNQKVKKIKQMRKDLRIIDTRVNINDDLNFRRFNYVRYGNDWIITFTGTFNEAQDIKNEINNFIQNNLLINNIDINIRQSSNLKSPIYFLNYNIIVQKSEDMKSIGKEIGFLIPRDKIIEIQKKFMKNNKPVHMNNKLHNNITDIILYYQLQWRGIIQYYKFARNQSCLTKLKWVLETLLIKTLAAKFKSTCKKMYKKYSSIKTVDGHQYKVIQYDNVYFGAIPLKRKIALDCNKINDSINAYDHKAYSYEHVKHIKDRF